MEKGENFMNHEIWQKKASNFEKQKPVIKKAKEDGFEEHAASLKNLSDFFVLKDRAVRCIDEGTPGGLHSAGSGILRDREEVLRDFQKAKVSAITSHDGCGAAKMYARAKGLDESMSDAYGQEWAKWLAAHLGVPYRHISSEEMARPKEFHISRTAYYDGTGKFDYGDGTEFPEGFVISREMQGVTTSLKEIEVSLSIVFGDSGYADLIAEEHPFVLVAIGKNLQETEQLKKELQTISHEYGEKVKIDGFTAPEGIE